MREITILYLVTHQLFTFYDSSSMDRRKLAHFTNVKFSTNFSQSQRNRFHYDPASMASFFLFLLPLFLFLCVEIYMHYLSLPLNTRFHFSCIDHNLLLIQPALTRKLCLKLQNLKWIYTYIRKLFELKIRIVSPRQEEPRKTESNQVPGIKEFHDKRLKSNWHD